MKIIRSLLIGGAVAIGLAGQLLAAPVYDPFAPRGQMVRVRAGAGTSARLPFGAAVSNDVVFFSFAIKVADVAGVGTGMDFINAFTPSDVAQANTHERFHPGLPAFGGERLPIRPLQVLFPCGKHCVALDHVRNQRHHLMNGDH